MNQPPSTPAIVAQSAVRRIPRWALLLFCLAYVVPGFVGRHPWKNEDMATLGYIFEIASGNSPWLRPELAGIPAERPAWLAYWMGALAMQHAPAWMTPDMAARLPFMALLALTLLATWFATCFLARRAEAQPVAFAFGGEANERDYACALADASVLALIACLGLAQFGHEATPNLVQLFCVSLLLCAFAASGRHPWLAFSCLLGGMAGLLLSAAGGTAVVLGGGGALLLLLEKTADETQRRRNLIQAISAALMAALCATLLWRLGLWDLNVTWPPRNGVMDWNSLARLIVWFTWPSLPLMLLGLWYWRRQWLRRHPPRHLVLPLGMFALLLSGAMLSLSRDRVLLLALPAMAVLAAFALPTINRSVSALIDWFTLLFFSVCAIVIWVIWISVVTGVPAKPAANVAKLAPEFEFVFSWTPLIFALLATAAWGWLVVWRTGRHRSAIWKSLVLPAGGAALCWQLMMTIWLPMLDYARSFAPQIAHVVAVVEPSPCVQMWGLSRAQIAALRYHGRLDVVAASAHATCDWLVADAGHTAGLEQALDMEEWTQRARLQRSANRDEHMLVFQRTRAVALAPPQTAAPGIDATMSAFVFSQPDF